MPPLLVLPDNTVLVNFALLQRMDLLAKLARNGTWCASVAHECDQSAKTPGLEAMSDAHEIFGEPLRPDSPVEHVMTQAFRTRLARPGDGRLRHLGEAETLAIMTCRSLHGIFVTDDSAVPVLAQEQGITVVTTLDLLRVARRGGLVQEDTLWSYVQVLRRQCRAMSRRFANRASFAEWLTE